MCSTVLDPSRIFFDGALLKQIELDRARPKQDMFRPCSIKKFCSTVLDLSKICFDRARPKTNRSTQAKNIFNRTQLKKSARPCSTKAR